MKQCPTCNRTYSDDAISFCLADGALLSAPYDPQATMEFPGSRGTDPAIAEIPSVKPTAAGHAEPPIGIVPPTGIKQENVNARSTVKEKSRAPLILIGILLIVGLSFVFFIGYKSGMQKTEGSNENSNVATLNPTSSPETSTNSATVKMYPEATIDPPGIKSTSNSNDSPQNTSGIGPGRGPGESAIDDGSKIFKPNEVSQKARILSKPAAEYTEAARHNQVTGTVVLQVVLTSSGTVTNIKAVAGLPYGLTEKAIAAARGIKFTPAIKDGKPVSQYIRVEYSFNVY